MDISALKVNVNLASGSTPTPIIKIASNSQTGSTSNYGELITKSSVNVSDNKSDKKPLKIEDIQQMTAAMNQFLQLSNPNMQFVLHEKTKELMVQFVDTKSGQVLKEFPSHEFLDTIANIQDYVGILLDKHI